MRAPANSKTWQIVEDQWPQFKKEPRHLRLGLATDGVNPYSLQQSKYSVWPVVMLNYNLPPHLTMSNAFMWLALIIPGRRHVHNMDIYLQPLIDELQLLWTQGVHGHNYILGLLKTNLQCVIYLLCLFFFSF
jgi:hypothetical protein